jgi:hypothetical protein
MALSTPSPVPLLYQFLLLRKHRFVKSGTAFCILPSEAFQDTAVLRDFSYDTTNCGGLRTVT